MFTRTRDHIAANLASTISDRRFILVFVVIIFVANILLIFLKWV